MLFMSLLLLGLWAGCLYALTAVGIVFIRQTCGFVNLAHGAVVVVGAYGAYLAMAWFHGDLVLGVFAGITVACGVSFGFEECVFRPLRQRGASALVTLLASLGLLVVVQNMIALSFGDQRLALPFQRSETTLVFGTQLTDTQIASLVCTVVLFAALASVLRGKVGLRVRAVADDPELAIISGVDIRRVIRVVTLISGITAGVAGFLWSCDNDLNPTIGFRALLFGLVAATVGGFRGLASAAVGGMCVGVVQYVSVLFIATHWQDVAAFVLLIFFLLFRPEGLLGRPVRKATI